MATGRASGRHGAFQLSRLLPPSVLPGLGGTGMSHLYVRALSLDCEIFRGYVSIKINILTQKMRLRCKRGVSNCALGSAVFPNPRWFGTAGWDHGNPVPGRNMVLKSNFVPSQN